MKKEIAIVGMIVCLGVGFVIGFFIPGLFTPAPEKSLVTKIENRESIIVGTSADYPPFENVVGGKIVGFDIDVSQLIADELGVDLVMKDIPFDSLIGACKAGTIDMIAAAMTYDPSSDTGIKRASQLAPSITYITVVKVVIVKNDSTLKIDSLEDLKGVDVGCQGGTTMEDELKDAGITPITYERVDTLMLDLDNGAIDAVYVDGPIYEHFKFLYTIKIIYTSEPDPLSLWCRKTTPDLLYVINEVLQAASLDGRMYAIWLTWFNATG